MQDEDIPDPGRLLDEIERLVLGLLLPSAGSGVCSIHELSVAVGDQEMVELAVADLHAAGLVHRIQEFVVATGAAARFHELNLAVVARLAPESFENRRPRHGWWPCRGLHGKKRGFFPCRIRVKPPG